MRTSVLLALIVTAPLATGCAKQRASTATGGTTTEDPSRPVARVSGQVITAGELNTTAKPQLAKLEAEHADRVHATRTQALDGMIDERLIAAKAKAAGLTPEKLLERDVKVPEPADAEVQGVYDRTKASGRELPPFEMVKGEIVKVLKERGAAEARSQYVQKLRAEAKVETMLPPPLPPKVEVAADGPSKGADKGAPITIVEFSDFECPYCSKAEEVVNKVMDAYKGKIRLVYRDYPLPFHANAQKASEAALCAGDQGKYWEMHAKLFANQQALAMADLKQHAAGVGLDAGKFGACLDSGAKAKDVAASKKAAESLGVSGTPHFFVNGRPLSGAQPFERFKEIIDHELAAAKK